MFRHIDPEFALQSRLSFGRWACYAWALTAAALFLGFNGIYLDTSPAVAFDRAGSFLLLAALPYGAIHVRALERRGQLDARRLTGRSPTALGMALVGGSAGALLFASVVLLLAGWAGGQILPPFTLAALVVLGVAMALVLLLMPGSLHVDSWMLLVLMLMGVASTVHVMRDDRAVTVGVLIVSALILPWALPMALRRMRGAPHQASGSSPSLLRRLINLRRTAHAEFWRGLLSSEASLPGAAAMTVAGALSIGWLTRHVAPDPRDAFEGVVVYSPLLVAGYDTAARVQYERVTGGLERLRLSAQAPWRVALEIALGFSLPFVAVSLLCAGALVLLDPVNARTDLVRWPFAAGMLVFGPLVGAFRGRKPAVCLAGTVLLLAALGGARAGWLVPVFALIVTAIVVAGAVEGAEQAPMRGTAAIIGTSLVSAIAVALVPWELTAVMAAGLVALGSGLLLPDRRPLQNRTVLRCAAAAAVAAGIASYFWVEGWRFNRLSLFVQLIPMRNGGIQVFPGIGPRGPYSVLVALSAGAGLLYGCLVHSRFGRTTIRSITWRGVPLALALAITEAGDSRPVYMWIDNFEKRTGYNGHALGELLIVGGFISVVCALYLRDRKALQRR